MLSTLCPPYITPDHKHLAQTYVLNPQELPYEEGVNKYSSSSFFTLQVSVGHFKGGLARPRRLLLSGIQDVGSKVWRQNNLFALHFGRFLPSFGRFY